MMRILLTLWLLGATSWAANNVTNLSIGTLLSPGALLSQVPSGGGTSPLNDVTNLAGYPMLAFYLPSATGYVTNGGVATLVDFGPNAWHMTNAAATSLWPVHQISIAGINNHDSVLFDGANDYLNSVIYTNGAKHEIIMVFRYNGVTNASVRYFYDGRAALGHKAGQWTAGQLFYGSSSLTITGELLTNRWIVFDFVMGETGVGSYGYTNNVSAGGTAIAQTKTQAGMVLGADHFISAWTPLDLALMVTYGSTDSSVPLPGTNTTARTAIFNALTNYFNLSP